jgi:hypothetical protein
MTTAPLCSSPVYLLASAVGQAITANPHLLQLPTRPLPNILSSLAFFRDASSAGRGEKTVAPLVREKKAHLL